jgi:hypothetical protein
MCSSAKIATVLIIALCQPLILAQSPAQEARIEDSDAKAAFRRPPAQSIEELNQIIKTLQDQLRRETRNGLRVEFARNLIEADRNVFDWQLRASEILMWVVIGVVVSGVLFSGYQLWFSLHIGVVPQTEFEVSREKARVTSSVVGVLVLIISLAFFYLFLNEVYRIRSVSSKVIESTEEQGATE